MAQQPKFLDDPPPTQEELDRMFRPIAGGGELIVPQQPAGRMVGGAELLITDVVTAKRVEVARDDAKILQKLAAIAAFAGDDVLLYRWPVKNRRTGKTDTVEGPTIKAAMAIARVYGNSRTDIASVDIGSSWIFKAVFSDFEAGVQTARLFQQHKGVAKIGGDDDARRLDMSYQIGQSKAIRNTIIAHLELPFVSYLCEEAKKNLVKRIGTNVEHYRGRIAQRLADMGIDVNRVERQVGRPLSGWLAPDLARVITELKAITDGMASAAESWPLEPAPEPRRSDAPTTSEPASSAAPSQGQAMQPEGSAAPQAAEAGAGSASASPAAPKDEEDELLDNIEPPPPHDESEPQQPVSRWLLQGSFTGQDAMLAALRGLLAETRTQADVEELLAANAERIAKVNASKAGSTWRMAVRDHQAAITAGRFS